MDEEMVRRWNEVVNPYDKVYHLGDVVINKKHLPTLSRLNGKKRLIRGNHDIFPTKIYGQYFDEIYGVRVLSDMILSHIPLHRECITDRFATNVHGHVHANEMMLGSEPDPRYLPVCVEHTDYRPLSLDEVRERIKSRKEAAGMEHTNGWGNGSGPG
jgi:calcineurin-like phosphoesterase family protein